MTRTKRVAVVGAGAGGLAAAAILSRDFDVSVYEHAPTPGGKIRQADLNGAKIDVGPTVFTMRWVFEDIFNAAGSDFATEVSTNKLEILARHGWRDGSSLDLFADKHQSAEAISVFASPREAKNFLAFCARTEKIYNTLRDPFICAQTPSLSGLIKNRNPRALLDISPFTTLWQALSRQFQDSRLRQLFGRYATYCGSSPFSSPATLMLIAHVEQEGVWAVEGGMQSVAIALAKAAEKNGATLHYQASVKTILTSGGQVSGVELANGERFDTDFVVFNGDPFAIEEGMFGSAAKRAIKLPSTVTRSQSAMTWALAAETDGFDLSMHNVFFSDDYKSEFDAVFTHRKIPETPTTYVFAPDCKDADNNITAPDQLKRLFCLINAPPTEDPNAFDEQETEQCRQRMLDHLQQCGLTIHSDATPISATTPQDFSRMFPGSRGALYGMASHGWQASFQRPGARTKLPGLYLAGGGVHPGPGVPMAALSGKAAAKAIMQDCGSTLQ
ncbi:MAG: 1-hydroxycarotenoid 3,4-desaturase CrtD [Pseudomonadota bacterium]